MLVPAKKFKSTGLLESLISSSPFSEERRRTIQGIIDAIEGTQEDDFEELEDDDTDFVFSDPILETDTAQQNVINVPAELEEFNIVESFKAYDKEILTASLDEENLDFLRKLY